VSDERGQKVAVLIDLQKHGKLWEDFYDSLIALQREKEPRETLDSVRRRLVKQGRKKCIMNLQPS